MITTPLGANRVNHGRRPPPLLGMRRNPASRGTRTTVLTACLIVLGLLVSGCLPPDDAGLSAKSTDHVEKPSGGCGEAGPKVAALLPAMGSDFRNVTTNPCVPFGGLLGAVSDLIPAAERETEAAQRFLGKLGNVTGQIAAVNDAVTCGYETDRLGIAVYQQVGYGWSVGVVAVLRGHFDALVEGATCWLRQQFGLSPRSAPATGAPKTGPVPTLCLHTAIPTRGDEVYTLLWLGSSDDMCGALDVLDR